MAIAFVNRVNGGSAASAGTVATSATSLTAGNLIVVMVQWQVNAGQTISGVADTAGNTYSYAGVQANSGINTGRIYYAYNCLGHASNIVTVTFSGNATYRAIVSQQFSGIETGSDPKNDTDIGSGTGTAIATPSLTVTASEEVICAFCIGLSNTISAGSGYSLVNFAVAGDGTKYFADEYHIVTGSEAATATCASAGWYIVAAAFKTATAATGQPTMRRWGGVPHMGGRSTSGKHAKTGRSFGRTRSGIYVPNHLKEAA